VKVAHLANKPPSCRRLLRFRALAFSNVPQAPARRGLVLGQGGTETQLIPAGVRHLKTVIEALPKVE
jgi:hypothetical protein